MPNKRQTESLFSPRPYSMFVGSHLKMSNGDYPHYATTGSGGSAFSSPARSPNLSSMKDLKK